MTTFTIDDVDQNVRDVDTQYGAMKAYRLSLMEPGATTPVVASWLRRATSPPPMVGQQIEGLLEDGQYGKKFREQRQMPMGSSGPRKSYEEDPKRAARIVRQHSQDMALTAIKMTIDMGMLSFNEDPERPNTIGSSEEFRRLIVMWADWFDKDAKAAEG